LRDSICACAGLRGDIPMTADIRLPAMVKIGAGAFNEVAGILSHLRCINPLIVTDAFLSGSGLADRLKQQILASGIACEVFSGSVADPTK
jgi:alcohol dehydrogenase class IV